MPFEELPSKSGHRGKEELVKDGERGMGRCERAEPVEDHLVNQGKQSPVDSCSLCQPWDWE